MVDSLQSNEIYTPSYVKKVLSSLGLRWKQETEGQINMCCPFHGDTSPSFSINTSTGQYFCFNPSCNSVGGLLDLVSKYGNLDEFQALRFMLKCKPNEQEVFMDTLVDLLTEEEEFDVFDPSVIQNLSENLSDRAVEYMAGRGIDKDTLKQFRVGYSQKKDMVSIPIYSHTNIPVGIIGRSIEGKRFEYSKNTPIAKVWFNLNQARRYSSTAIIVEASMDALKIHQAGFKNVIAILGGQVSDYKLDLLNKYFDKIVIMTDSDGLKKYDRCKNKKCKSGCVGHDPGRDAGMKIAAGFTREVMWAAWSSDIVYPHSAKDPGDLTLEEIRQLVMNPMPDYEYRQFFDTMV